MPCLDGVCRLAALGETGDAIGCSETPGGPWRETGLDVCGVVRASSCIVLSDCGIGGTRCAVDTGLGGPTAVGEISARFEAGFNAGLSGSDFGFAKRINVSGVLWYIEPNDAV